MRNFFTLFVDGKPLGQWKIFKNGAHFRERKWYSAQPCMKLAKHFHQDNHGIHVFEQNKEGIVATWEMEAGSDLVIFTDKVA